MSWYEVYEKKEDMKVADLILKLIVVFWKSGNIKIIIDKGDDAYRFKKDGLKVVGSDLWIK